MSRTLRPDDLADLLHGYNGWRVSAELLEGFPNLRVIHYLREVGRSGCGVAPRRRVGMTYGGAQGQAGDEPTCCEHDEVVWMVAYNELLSFPEAVKSSCDGVGRFT